MERLLEATARAERDHFWFRAFRRFVVPLVREAARGRPGGRILDCGSGTGANLAWLQAHGRPVGIDITWSGLAYARGRGERRLAQASATALPFAEATFDVVTSFDVIITLPDADEAAALGEMHRVLKPGGYVVINVAALDLLRGNHSILAREVRRYTRRRLGTRLARAGFEVRRMTYTNASTTPLLAAVRLAQRLSGGHQESEQEISIPPAPLNAALSGILAVEAVALRFVNMPFGSSLLALARKPDGRKTRL
jgi:ubiquinone/menaquinone biosynthesis C-methylase UbiE